ncbi:uncharacterized protein LOC141844702 [Curcuma longa]|uniref:uncharacterized protein LOC141844702 n=1 Tax=Curcuma longa TaxID=136217 RepID=UPI003D9FB06E
MSGDIGGRLQRLLLLLLLVVAISLHTIAGLADDPPKSKNVVNAEVNTYNSGTTTRPEVLFVCVVLAGVVLLAVFLFKLWQKKKREEQHARLLRLFEEDDDLEVELGLRD